MSSCSGLAWPGLAWPGLAEHDPPAAEQPGVDEVRKRLMYSQSLEAARCVAEGIVSEHDADVGSVLGGGFPAARGGAISHINTVGAARFVDKRDALANAHGQRSEVPPALRDMAACGDRCDAARDDMRRRSRAGKCVDRRANFQTVTRAT